MEELEALFDQYKNSYPTLAEELARDVCRALITEIVSGPGMKSRETYLAEQYDEWAEQRLRPLRQRHHNLLNQGI